MWHVSAQLVNLFDALFMCEVTLTVFLVQGKQSALVLTGCSKNRGKRWRGEMLLTCSEVSVVRDGASEGIRPSVVVRSCKHDRMFTPDVCDVSSAFPQTKFPVRKGPDGFPGYYLETTRQNLCSETWKRNLQAGEKSHADGKQSKVGVRVRGQGPEQGQAVKWLFLIVQLFFVSKPEFAQNESGAGKQQPTSPGM